MAASFALDPENLAGVEGSQMNFGTERKRKWKDIWGAGQSVSGIHEELPAAELIARLHREYLEARRKLGGASPLVNPNWAKLAQAA